MQARLFRLVVKFKGDTVKVTSLRRAAHGRYAVHSTSQFDRASLSDKLVDGDFQKRHLLRTKVAR